MKKFLLLVTTLIGLLSSSVFAESTCPVYCDEQWKACMQSCVGGSDARACKNQCAEQHENCLNGCRKHVQLDQSARTVADSSFDAPLQQYKKPAVEH